ncbi:hypothetical protein E2C01_032780 [Portunus trituberculatus]|uniref:Uncharacterized protein n=1 Tax=Portunus trituberculatus TaxID=210409 RepID=A0A5B7EW51_PORTR|nr:hypothetical protein [Portunus trituberculatus]
MDNSYAVSGSPQAGEMLGDVWVLPNDLLLEAAVVEAEAAEASPASRSLPEINTRTRTTTHAVLPLESLVIQENNRVELCVIFIFLTLLTMRFIPSYALFVMAFWVLSRGKGGKLECLRFSGNIGNQWNAERGNVIVASHERRHADNDARY